MLNLFCAFPYLTLLIFKNKKFQKFIISMQFRLKNNIIVHQILGEKNFYIYNLLSKYFFYFKKNVNYIMHMLLYKIIAT